MTKEDLVDPLKKIRNKDADRDFPPDLKPRELETLTVSISRRIELEKQHSPPLAG